jgi:hypothetical protein
MRRAISPIQPPAVLHVDLGERLRVTARRLEAMPPELATSLSITAGWHGLSETQVRALARVASAPFGFAEEVQALHDAVTVTFRRQR